MANLKVKNGDGSDAYLKATGAGSNGDPHIVEHTIAGAATAANQATANTSLSSIDGKTPALGQALAAASVPVALPAAQVTALTPPAAITGFLTESDFDTKAGALTETAPASDTASSGLNGRLQRIAQRLSSLIALLPTSLSNGSLRVSLQEASANVNPTSRAASTGDRHLPASNTAAIVTYAAGGAGVSHAISGVAWSYDGAPTGGNLKIEDGSGTTVFSIDITAAGPGFIPFARGKKGTANTAMIITLAAGGSGVTGKVNALEHWTE